MKPPEKSMSDEEKPAASPLPIPIVTRLEEAIEAGKARLEAIAATRADLDREEAGIRRYLPATEPAPQAAPVKPVRKPVEPAVKKALAAEEKPADWKVWAEAHELKYSSVRRAVKRLGKAA